MKIKEMNVPVAEHEQQYEDDEDEDDDEGSFIEISLDAKTRWENAENIFQFRLSFSTMLPRNSDSGGSFRHKLLMSAESVKSTSSKSSTLSYDSFSSSISSSSSASSVVLNRSNARRNHSGMAFPTPEQIKSPETHVTENKWKKVVQFLAVQRIVKLLNMRSSTENTKLYDTKERTNVSEVISSGVMNLIVKFKTLKSKSRNTLTRASNHISVQRHKCYKSSVIEPISVIKGKRVNKTKLPEASKNSIKGMIDSLTVSCPASIKSSPVHRNYCATESIVKTYTRENSIQAAIAHCKMSLDQISVVPDFSIRDK